MSKTGPNLKSVLNEWAVIALFVGFCAWFIVLTALIFVPSYRILDLTGMGFGGNKVPEGLDASIKAYQLAVKETLVSLVTTFVTALVTYVFAHVGVTTFRYYIERMKKGPTPD